MTRCTVGLLATLIVAGTRLHGAVVAQASTAETIDSVRLVVSERMRQGTPPVLVLAMETLRKYPCLGYGLENTFTQQGATIRLNLLTVVPPQGVCPTAIGPATMACELHIAAGRYTVLITYGSRTDRFVLEVTDSSTAILTERASFVQPDTRLRWRFPSQSFALFCESVSVALPVCNDFKRWLTRQPGVIEVGLSPAGLSPYPGGSDQRVDLFRYRDSLVLSIVSRCFAEIEENIREAVGVFLTIRTWTGQQIAAWSRKSYDEPHIPVPDNVTSGPACSHTD